MTTVALITLSLGIFIGFLVQAFTGFAAGAIALPILVFAFPLQDSVVIISVLLFLSSLLLTIKNWRFIDKAVLSRLAWVSTVGIAFGVATLKFGNPKLLVQLLGLFIIAYSTYQHVQPRTILFLKDQNILCGLFGGYFAGLFSAGGPVFALYLSNMIDDTKVLRATTIGIVLVLATTRLIFLTLGKLVTFPLLKTSMIALPFFVVAVILGQILHDKVSNAVFRRISLIFLLLCGVVLLLK